MTSRCLLYRSQNDTSWYQDANVQLNQIESKQKKKKKNEKKRAPNKQVLSDVARITWHNASLSCERACQPACTKCIFNRRSFLCLFFVFFFFSSFSFIRNNWMEKEKKKTHKHFEWYSNVILKVTNCLAETKWFGRLHEIAHTFLHHSIFYSAGSTFKVDRNKIICVFLFHVFCVINT